MSAAAANAGGSRERLTGRQESVSLPPLRSEATWENGVYHSGSRGFADTEGVTGSNPVAPTNKALTSVNAVALTITALTQRRRWSVRCFGPVAAAVYRMERVSHA
jgi:hypothetical protein